MKIYYPDHQGYELWRTVFGVINKYFGEYDYYDSDYGNYDTEKSTRENEDSPTMYRVWIAPMGFNPNKPENRPVPAVVEARKFRDWKTDNEYPEFSEFYLGLVEPVNYGGSWSFDYKKIVSRENLAIPDLAGNIKTKKRWVEHVLDQKIRKLIYEERYRYFKRLKTSSK